MEQEKVTGVALKTNLGRITITELPVGAGAQALLFARLAERSILVDDIIQNQVSSRTANVSFTVDHADLVEIKPVVEEVLREVGGGARSPAPGGGTVLSPGRSAAEPGESRPRSHGAPDGAKGASDAQRVPDPAAVGGGGGASFEPRPPRSEGLPSAAPAMRVDVGLCKVSAVGVGMRTHTGVAAQMFRALSDAGINIENITTSEIKISCILPQTDGERALRAVHAAFGLGTGEGVGEAVGARIEE